MTNIFLTASQQPASYLPSRAAPDQGISSAQSSAMIALIITNALVLSVVVSIIGYKLDQRYHFRRRVQTLDECGVSPYRKHAHTQSCEPIPCRNCRFFKDSRYLRCAVHPSTVLTKQALNCLDYQPRESQG